MSDQRKVDEDAQEDSTADRWWIVGAGVVAILFLALSHVFYWLWRNNVVGEFGEDKWGQYGDFIGGITNPIISLLTFGGLLYTILVQRRELALQRRELSNSSKALRATEEELRQTKEIAAGQAEFYKKESEKSDIERVLERLRVELDADLSWRESRGHYTVMENFFHSSAEIVHHYVGKKEGYEEYFDKAGKVIDNLLLLNYFLSLYSTIDKGSAVIAYYVSKYRSLSVKINDVGWEFPGGFSALLEYDGLPIGRRRS